MKPASVYWLRESNKVFDEEVAFQPRFYDPDTGIPILRLTSQPVINQNIYPEAHISTPDGKRFIFLRRLPLGDHSSFWIADLETLFIRQITDEADATVPVVSPDGMNFYYMADGKVRRIDAGSFEREDVMPLPKWPLIRGGFVTMDPTGKRFVVAAVNENGEPGAAVLELESRSLAMIYKNPEALNAHPQFSRNSDTKVMIQVNNGIEVDAHNNLIRLVGELGASLVVMDPDGGNVQRLQAGYSLQERVQGHQCWVGDQNRAITTLHRRDSVTSTWIQDRIITIAPGESQYRVVGQGPGFTHIHTDPTGRFWISDCNRTGDIFVGSVETGRFRLFCRSGASFGCSQETHPHPFFLGDGKTVGWNSDQTGVTHIYCARIPQGFLDSLI